MNQQSIIAALKNRQLETPNWGYGNSGTPFKTFLAAGTARTVCEKLEAQRTMMAAFQTDYFERVGATRGTSSAGGGFSI